jgi:hypothetical protein
MRKVLASHGHIVTSHVNVSLLTSKRGHVSLALDAPLLV